MNPGAGADLPCSRGNASKRTGVWPRPSIEVSPTRAAPWRFGLLVLVRPSAYRRYRTAFETTSLLGVTVS
jgi:hypothetical protein